MSSKKKKFDSFLFFFGSDSPITWFSILVFAWGLEEKGDNIKQ